MIDENDTDDWASAEFSEANLGDARLTQRLVVLARRLASSPQVSFPQSLKPAELKGAYRFFHNVQVDANGILAPHIAQTLDRMSVVPVVLAVQDTTEFNLSHLHATEGLGYGSGRHERGFIMHSLLAVTPEGLPLGVLGMKTWVRPEEEFGKKPHPNTRRIEEKESIRWLEGIEHLAALKARCAQTRFVCVGDRESDLYELFAAKRPAGVDWLIRAAHNRRARHPQGYLWEAVLATAPLGKTQLCVPARSNLPQRTARLTLRCSTVRLRPPKARASRLPEVDIFAIHAIEDNPPRGVEPLEWMLLSSVPTTSLDEVLERLAWYARRWTIETWHRVLKSGCHIEARQFGTLERFVRATALFAVIAWRILYATLLARTDTDLCCQVLLQPVEWQALYCHTHRTTQLPKEVPTLQQTILWIGMLGGYLNRKHDRPPGPTVIWRGFLLLHEITKMYQLFRQSG
ncbi:Transposase DDE domain-containing protein [Burkholderia sp. WP9]|uniref:IS4 family transposase n=1 Tax=Burkholderia sp. WP9 TaxID=1500263 RepID=UPI00089D69DA|nr:IS4 family transposase [Burkholderia sp. WP9]SEF12485.1 Transposase DDE domain-containing protein [Burkholderia sp. WP9]